MLQEFFEEQLPQYMESDLLPIGKKIIELCLNKASLEDYNEVIPMEYGYTFGNLQDFEDEDEVLAGELV